MYDPTEELLVAQKETIRTIKEWVEGWKNHFGLRPTTTLEEAKSYMKAKGVTTFTDGDEQQHDMLAFLDELFAKDEVVKRAEAAFALAERGEFQSAYQQILRGLGKSDQDIAAVVTSVSAPENRQQSAQNLQVIAAQKDHLLAPNAQKMLEAGRQCGFYPQAESQPLLKKEDEGCCASTCVVS